MLFVLIFYIVCLGLVGRIVFSPVEKAYEFPSVTTIVFVAFLLPQFLSLSYNSYPISDWAVELTAFIAIACLLVVWIDYAKFEPSLNLIKRFESHYSTERLFYFGLFYSMVGSLAYLAIGDSSDETGGSWEGMIQIYQLFSKLIYSGIALLLYSALTKPSVLKWSSFAISITIPGIKIILAARRTDLAWFSCIIIVLLFLVKKYVPPKIMLVSLTIVATVFVLFVAAIRGELSKLELDTYNVGEMVRFEWVSEYINALRNIDWLNEFSKFFFGDPDDPFKEQISELRFGASVIQVAQERMEFTLGTEFWNKLVLGWVPAVFVGRAVKNSLYIDSTHIYQTVNLVNQRFNGLTHNSGLALPVVSQVFQSFWLFGPLLYIPFARFYKTLWIASKYLDNPLVKIFYAISLPSIGIGVAMGLPNLLNQELVQLFLLLPAVFFCRIPVSSSAKKQV